MQSENSGSGKEKRNLDLENPVSGSGFQKCFLVVPYIHTFHPKTAVDVSPYMEAAAKKELARMLDAGMLEEIEHYTENLS